MALEVPEAQEKTTSWVWPGQRAEVKESKKLATAAAAISGSNAISSSFRAASCEQSVGSFFGKKDRFEAQISARAGSAEKGGRGGEDGTNQRNGISPLPSLPFFFKRGN